MKIATRLALGLLLLATVSHWASGTAPTAPAAPAETAPAPSFDPQDLIGTWEHKETKGTMTMLGYNVYRSDGTGLTVARLANGNDEVWLAIESTWKLDGNSLTLTAVRATKPGPPAGTTNSYSVLELNRTLFSYVGDKQKKVNKDTRVLALPAPFEAKAKEMLP